MPSVAAVLGPAFDVLAAFVDGASLVGGALVTTTFREQPAAATAASEIVSSARITGYDLLCAVIPAGRGARGEARDFTGKRCSG
jgi:hypothetical protein